MKGGKGGSGGREGNVEGGRVGEEKEQIEYCCI